ncbi:MAG: response regulator [Planctomycetaceae bacterium]|jgi:two-component system chemotaxis response regulator CheY|nr:response regulator [Planctomycetaceae bacterium]
MIKNVVIADDSALARMFIRRCLEIAGLGDANFFEASDGSEAILRMKEIKADLLVTDLTMPNMNGIELMRKISASPRLSGTPVLVVTSAGNEEQRKELMELGATQILSKPISPPILVEAIQKVNALLKGRIDEEGRITGTVGSD